MPLAPCVFLEHYFVMWCLVEPILKSGVDSCDRLFSVQLLRNNYDGGASSSEIRLEVILGLRLSESNVCPMNSRSDVWARSKLIRYPEIRDLRPAVARGASEGKL